MCDNAPLPEQLQNATLRGRSVIPRHTTRQFAVRVFAHNTSVSTPEHVARFGMSQGIAPVFCAIEAWASP